MSSFHRPLASLVSQEVFGDQTFVDEFGVCSVNSINVARVLTQSSYYIFAYCSAMAEGKLRLGDPITFAVPTGAFGNW